MSTKIGNRYVTRKMEATSLTAKREYHKVSKQNRVELLRRVLIHEEQLKFTAANLGIKYPTAKKIMRDYRNGRNRPIIGLTKIIPLSLCDQEIKTGPILPSMVVS
jgi:hypothetical protein